MKGLTLYSVGRVLKLVRNLLGQKFGRLTVMSKTNERKNKGVVWLCECECKSVVRATTIHLTSGWVKSCGCLRVDNGASQFTKHGMYRTPTNITWMDMLQRCENPNAKNFKYYGKRGISVCQDWHNFENFIRDMGNRPSGRTLDRINNDGNYEKENCRWATSKEQSQNQRHNNQYTKNRGV